MSFSPSIHGCTTLVDAWPSAGQASSHKNPLRTRSPSGEGRETQRGPVLCGSSFPPSHMSAMPSPDVDPFYDRQLRLVRNSLGSPQGLRHDAAIRARHLSCDIGNWLERHAQHAERVQSSVLSWMSFATGVLQASSSSSRRRVIIEYVLYHLGSILQRQPSC